MATALRQRITTRVASWRPEEGDAVLYAASALIAGLMIEFSNIAVYRQWGEMAVGVYLLAAMISAFANRGVAAEAHGLDSAFPASAGFGKPGRHWSATRIWVFVFVLAGATLLPLSLEIAWRSDGNPSAHVQPEAPVVEQAAQRLAQGKDPYQNVTRDGRPVIENPGEPEYEIFFPYLPLMTIFGLPSSTKEPIRLTDARIFFSIVTLLLVAGSLALSRGPNEAKVRTLQVLTVLPTAALPLATGGDDMPIVAFLLLAMVLAQRRQPVLSGFVLGVASAMKFTVWPLAALALFAARDKRGKRAPVRMALGMLIVLAPVVVPFVLRGPHAFFENVVLYPLGLSGVPAQAASVLPGHLIVTAFPWLHRILPVTVGLIGGIALALHLWRHPPRSSGEVSTLAGWVLLVAVLFAPATRFGYLLYPINFFVWGHLLRGTDKHEYPIADDDRVLESVGV